MEILRLPELAFEGRERRSRCSALKTWEYTMNFGLGMESVAPAPKSRSLRTQDGDPASPRVASERSRAPLSPFGGKAWEYAMNSGFGMESVAPTPESRSLRTQDGSCVSQSWRLEDERCSRRSTPENREIRDEFRLGNGESN
jgi:hypothetical protein